MSLDAVADELYALTPGEFTAARNHRATELPEARVLKKPSAAAWAINQFARRRSDELDQVFSLGEQLREAQDELNSAVLRALGSKRRSLVSAIATQVAELATELGDPIGASARVEVELTLQAAMADPRAADAVRTGRLVRSLSTDGLDEVDLEGAIAGSVPRRQPARPNAKDLRKKQQERADAEAADNTAQAAKNQADDRLADAKRRTAELASEIDALTSRLTAARAELSQARSAATRLAAEQRAASRDAEHAAARLRDASA